MSRLFRLFGRFSLFPYFYLPPGLMPVTSSSSSCCFIRAAALCSSWARMLFFLQPLWSSRLTFFRTLVGFFCPLPFSAFCGISVLIFVLFRPCSSYLFLFSTYVVLLAAFLIFLHHILQNSCLLFFCCLFSSCFHYFFWSGSFCCDLVPGTLAFHLPYLD